MGILRHSEPAKRAWVLSLKFHGYKECMFNECSHNRWEPRAKGELCDKSPSSMGRDCNSYNPTRPHKYYYNPPRTYRRHRKHDGASYSGYENADSWGVSPWD